MCVFPIQLVYDGDGGLSLTMEDFWIPQKLSFICLKIDIFVCLDDSV